MFQNFVFKLLDKCIDVTIKPTIDTMLGIAIAKRLSATIAKLGKNEYINMKSLEKLCEVLECKVEDIIEYVPSGI
ncbi:hypothetical protein CULT_1500004 [[Clostridium] ultunense Esp]|uniref:Uncharacterized HTH-type transcriptional regulator YozG n=1 Tax=[Clostridium] ultunense Esp TaxID=1288971 RepID=M1Z709_9FIRM|nr:helix-turn-helix domain-containing protein [Schnuerera ultunensis]CCQ93801.1 hypothetical protein CULT_1500004 [[Clostridium] ultunense Esp]SHD76795.1 Uncharacterized HTH-type transcriptional regulator YozG [[Clostridium] ultunense Esp]